MEARGRVDEQSTRHFVHSIDVIDERGQLWCRFTKIRLWRFYLPFHGVNFHGPKDVYYLSDPWPLSLPDPAQHGSSPNGSAGDHEPQDPSARSWCSRMKPLGDLAQSALQSAASRVTLSHDEQRLFENLERPDDKKAEWLFGRFCAKDAVRSLLRKRTGERPFMADIEIETDPYGRPVARPRDQERAEDYPNVSISHTDELVVALAAIAPRVGIDVERVAPRGEGFQRIALDESERALLDVFGEDRDEGIARFWCAKESVGKALGRGLDGGPRNLVVTGVDQATGVVRVRLGPQLAAAFPDLDGAQLLAYTKREEEYVVATTLCERG